MGKTGKLARVADLKFLLLLPNPDPTRFFKVKKAKPPAVLPPGV
jgi:hypothetical protein